MLVINEVGSGSEYDEAKPPISDLPLASDLSVSGLPEETPALQVNEVAPIFPGQLSQNTFLHDIDLDLCWKAGDPRKGLRKIRDCDLAPAVRCFLRLSSRLTSSPPR